MQGRGTPAPAPSPVPTPPLNKAVIPPGTFIPPSYTAREEGGLPLNPATGDVLLVFDSPAAEAPAERAETGGETPWRMVGEVLNTYIIVEQGDKVIFIDKHAAHERMGFDALKAQDVRPMSQTLLAPLSVTLRANQREALLEHERELEEFGFRLEEWGDGILVRACPDFLDSAHISPTLEELAEQYLTMGTVDPGSQRDALLHTMACKAAMKGGQKNQPEELFVIAKAVMDKKVTHCPHGRPVATELSKAHLEKQFGRA